MKNVTSVFKPKTLAIILVTSVAAMSVPAHAALIFDTTEIVAASTTILTAIGAVGTAFILVSAAIKAYSYFKNLLTVRSSEGMSYRKTSRGWEEI